MVCLAAAGLLGRHILGRALHRAALGDVRTGDEFGQAEVGNLQLAVGIEHQVAGLDIAMQHLVAMGVRQGLGQLQRKIDDTGDGHLAAAGAQLPQLGPQGVSGQVLEHQKRFAFEVGRLVNDGDVRMIERGNGACFLLEANAGGLGIQQVSGEKLQCDDAIELDIASFVHDAHAAGAELLQNLVVGNCLADHCRSPSPTHPVWWGGYRVNINP
jgi:hypothetical protein